MSNLEKGVTVFLGGLIVIALATTLVWDPLESTCRHASLSIL